MRLKKKRVESELTTDEKPASEVEPTLDFDKLQSSFVLYSNFRSGSHLLKLTIANLLGMSAPPEPLNVSSGLDYGYYYSDFVNEPAFDAESALANGHKTLFDFTARFFENLSDDRSPIIDIKYPQAYLMGLNQLTMLPVVLEAFDEWKVPIIHLIRKDVFAQAISHLVASKSGDYLKNSGVRSDTRATSNQKYWLDPEEVLQVAKARRHATELAVHQLSLLKRPVLTVFYENLISENVENEYLRCFQFLNKYTEIPEDFGSKTENQKSASKVANLKEIENYILNTDPMILNQF